METHNSPDAFFFKTHLTSQAAWEAAGYNAQYLRQFLRIGKFKGDKIGQIWLIRRASLDEYLQNFEDANDQRFGPKSSGRIF